MKKINAKSKGLGRGLSSLLGEENFNKRNQTKDHDVNNNYKKIPIELIYPGPWQPRKIFAKDEIKSLAKSIEKQGIIQPIVLKTKKNNPDQYYIIAGERRWRAAQIANIHKIPAIIMVGSFALVRSLGME